MPTDSSLPARCSIRLPTTEGWIEVSFTFIQDRFAHHVQWFSGATHLALLSSCEGDDEQPWPPSPPMQQLDGAAVHGGKAILGVGLAGQSHWSLSVCVQEQAKRIEWDVACRVAGQPQWLGSTYRLWCALDHEPDGNFLVALPDGELRLSAAVEDPGRSYAEQNGEWLIIAPADFPTRNAAAQTYRWRYYCELV